MSTEDLLQPGHVVKERWKVVSKKFIRFLCIMEIFSFVENTFDTF